MPDLPVELSPYTIPVHNHGTEDGPGLSCPEYRTDGGRLRGTCLDTTP